MILEAKLKFWNLFSSGPKSQSDKISVLIFFIPSAFFCRSYSHLKHGPVFLGHPVYIHHTFYLQKAFSLYFTFVLVTCDNPEDDTVTEDGDDHDEAERSQPQHSDWSITKTCARYVVVTDKWTG